VLVMERAAAELEGENLEKLYVQYMAGHTGSKKHEEIKQQEIT